MKGLIDLINTYGGTAIIGIVVALCFAIREGVEFYEWCKKRFDKSVDSKITQEGEKLSIEERISMLEEHDRDQQQRLIKVQDTLDFLDGQVLNIVIDRYRESILNFADDATDENRFPSKEKYNNIFSIYQKYEDILEKNGLSNGLAETSIELIRQSYKHRMETHTFLEDVRVNKNE